MQCGKCKYNHTRVVSTDHNDVRNLIQRRRECLRCGKRFTTHEKLREVGTNDDRFPHGKTYGMPYT
jgi:transcriptional repressor NrdR